MKKISLCFILVSGISFAQVGIGTTTLHPDALLELKNPGDNGGLLLDTVALVSVASPAPFPSHIQGMTVYNTATSATDPEHISPGMYYNDGTSWVRMAIDKTFPIPGDIKQSALTADHEGWYMLDGRLLASLPANAQQNAANLGITTSLPNANDATPKAKNGIEIFGAVGGATSFTIAQANLPNITYSGTTSSAGAHTHSYVDRGNTYWNYLAGGVGGMRYVDGQTRTTLSAGAHTHTVTAPSGGTNTPISFRPKYLVVQSFIYLGL